MECFKRHILCTEDNADSRELIVYMLEAADYHVTITTDPADALSQAQRERFDLILVNNWMPGLSGQEPGFCYEFLHFVE